MSDKRFEVLFYGDVINCVRDERGKEYNLHETITILNEQQFIIEELKTHNLQHFLEWLVIKGYVTDEPMKDINNVIDCVNKFKEYLSVLNKLTEINNEIGFDSDE